MENDSFSSKWNAVEDSIGYDTYDFAARIASPQHEVLYQNEDKTVVYQVEYHADTTAEKAVAEFEKGKENISKEKSTWEDKMQEYNDIFVEKHNGKHAMLFTSRRDWDIDLWEYVENNEKNKTVTETLFFERADGCYSIEMTYPTNDTIARNTLYSLFFYQRFRIDDERWTKINNSIEWNYEVKDDGGLVITVTNNNDETVDTISCIIDAKVPDEKQLDEEMMDFDYSDSKSDVKPKETFTFELTAEEIKDLGHLTAEQEKRIKDYVFNVYVGYLERTRKREENGEIWEY